MSYWGDPNGRAVHDESYVALVSVQISPRSLPDKKNVAEYELEYESCHLLNATNGA